MTKPRFSLSRRIFLVFLLSVLVVAGTAVLASFFKLRPTSVFLVTAVAGGTLGFWLLSGLLAPLRQSFAALLNGIHSFRDRDFSVRLHYERDDELGELIELYNQVGDLLRAERSAIFQKELMLDTVLQTSPTALILTNARDRVVLSNRAAQELFFEGKEKLEGLSFSDILSGCPPQMVQAVTTESDSLFTVPSASEPDVYHISKRIFHLNGQKHSLYLIHRLTKELSRQEVEVWKKAIRIMSHELNNSLAPISSLVHSAASISGQPGEEGRLKLIYESITERVTHLKTFLEGYACFARLPKPEKQSVEWEPFLRRVQQLYDFKIDGPLPGWPGFFDPTQLQQVLINLVKNAAESGSQPDDIAVRIESSPQLGTSIVITDRGPGMNDEVLRHALLPFYSTKQAGAGLGLPLCREIVEAHGGHLRIANRAGGGLVVTCVLPAA